MSLYVVGQIVFMTHEHMTYDRKHVLKFAEPVIVTDVEKGRGGNKYRVIAKSNKRRFAWVTARDLMAQKPFSHNEPLVWR